MKEIGTLEIIWEFGIFKNYLRMNENSIWKKLEFQNLLESEILEIKLEINWDFEIYSRIGDLQNKFKDWNFEN